MESPKKLSARSLWIPPLSYQQCWSNWSFSFLWALPLTQTELLTVLPRPLPLQQGLRRPTTFLPYLWGHSHSISVCPFLNIPFFISKRLFGVTIFFFQVIMRMFYILDLSLIIFYTFFYQFYPINTLFSQEYLTSLDYLYLSALFFIIIWFYLQTVECRTDTLLPRSPLKKLK